MLSNLNDWDAIDRTPQGRLVWLSAISRIDKMAQEEATEYFSTELALIAKDLVERDLRDIEVSGRRLHISDMKEPLQDAYFYLIEALGRLDAACDSDEDIERRMLMQNCALLAAEVRKAMQNGQKK